VARFVISRLAKTHDAPEPSTRTEVDALLEQQGIEVVQADRDQLLVDSTDDQAKALADSLRGWAVAPEREYDYPRRNPALRNPKKLFE
jgi:hypothetical protein